MAKKRLEDTIRDELATKIDPDTAPLSNLIQNFDTYKNALKVSIQNFLAKPESPGAKELFEQVTRKKQLYGLEAIPYLKIVDKEFRLLKTGKRGKKPSADILAFEPETGSLCVIEVKIDSSSERESITELSAYSQGINNRFFGFSSTDIIWLPISTEWRITTSSACAYQMLFRGSVILPLKLSINSTTKTIEHLDIEDVISQITSPQACALFSYASYDCMCISLAQKPLYDAQIFLHFISSIATRLGLSGFVWYSESNVGNCFSYPYEFFLGIYNPFKGGIKKRQLEIVLESDGGEEEMKKQVKESLWTEHDLDLYPEVDLTEKDCWINPSSDFEPEPRISVSELALGGGSSQSILFREIKSFLSGIGINDSELSYPDLNGILTGNHMLLNAIENVAYFGFIQEAVFERIKHDHFHEHLHSLSITEAYSSFYYFDMFMRAMNYQD